MLAYRALKKYHITLLVDALESSVPELSEVADEKPWEDESLKELVDRVQAAACELAVIIRGSLKKQLGKKGRQLKNEYYAQKAAEINELHVQKKAAREFKAVVDMASGMHKTVFNKCSTTLFT